MEMYRWGWLVNGFYGVELTNIANKNEGQSLCDDDKRIRRADCEHCIIRERMLFADLDVQRAASLLAHVTNIIYQPGEVIFNFGDQPTALYSVRKGIVKLSIWSPEGEMRIVRLLGPGAVIGLETQLDSPYEHTAQCLSTVDVCRIPAGTLRQLVHDQPLLYEAIIRRWNDHTQLADRHLLTLTSGSIKERVLQLLLLLDELSRLSGSPLVLLPNQDCAIAIGARIESVSRIMAEFKRCGALHRLQEKGTWAFRPNLIPVDP